MKRKLFTIVILLSALACCLSAPSIAQEETEATEKQEEKKGARSKLADKWCKKELADAKKAVSLVKKYCKNYKTAKKVAPKLCKLAEPHKPWLDGSTDDDEPLKCAMGLTLKEVKEARAKYVKKRETLLEELNSIPCGAAVDEWTDAPEDTSELKKMDLEFSKAIMIFHDMLSDG